MWSKSGVRVLQSLGFPLAAAEQGGQRPGAGATADSRVDSVVSCLDHKVKSEGPSIGLIVGAAIGGMAVLAIIITPVVIILGKKKTEKGNINIVEC